MSKRKMDYKEQDSHIIVSDLYDFRVKTACNGYIVEYDDKLLTSQMVFLTKEALMQFIQDNLK